MTRRGGVGKGTGSKGCRGAEHGQACTTERTGAVAVRAALQSAVQVGRGNEGNRQAGEMANPTKCRDSLQAPRCTGNGRTDGHGIWPAAVFNFKHSAYSTVQQTESSSENFIS
jgi:hypothetical protein